MRTIGPDPYFAYKADFFRDLFPAGIEGFFTSWGTEHCIQRLLWSAGSPVLGQEYLLNTRYFSGSGCCTERLGISTPGRKSKR